MAGRRGGPEGEAAGRRGGPEGEPTRKESRPGRRGGWKESRPGPRALWQSPQMFFRARGEELEHFEQAGDRILLGSFLVFKVHSGFLCEWPVDDKSGNMDTSWEAMVGKGLGKVRRR